MKTEKENGIELRSEEVQEILTRPPHALVRWGITVFFGVLAAVFIGGCFFQYPDVVDATVTVTTERPPVWMVTRGSGKIKEVYHRDRDSVYAGDLIAVLENPARTADVRELKERLRTFSLTDSCVQAARFPDRPALGSVQTAYASAKAGINGLTKSCAKELGRFGIRVNAVAPGVVLTDMVAASVDERMMAGLQQLTPLGRAANPEELAPAYVYLASDDASFTTGAILSVDGGIVM